MIEIFYYLSQNEIVLYDYKRKILETKTIKIDNFEVKEIINSEVRGDLVYIGTMRE